MLTEAQLRKPVAVRLISGGIPIGWKLYRRGGIFGTYTFMRYVYDEEGEV